MAVPVPVPVRFPHPHRGRRWAIVPLEEAVPHLLVLRRHEGRELRRLGVEGVEEGEGPARGVAPRHQLARLGVQQVGPARRQLRHRHEAVWGVWGCVVYVSCRRELSTCQAGVGF